MKRYFLAFVIAGALVTACASPAATPTLTPKPPTPTPAAGGAVATPGPAGSLNLESLALQKGELPESFIVERASGSLDVAKAAKAYVNAAEAEAKLTAAGFQGGHDANYSKEASADAANKGTLEVRSRVMAFGSAQGAATAFAYIAGQAKGTKLSVDTVGDEIYGTVWMEKLAGPETKFTFIFFRKGNVIASAIINSLFGEKEIEEALGYLKKIEARIK